MRGKETVYRSPASIGKLPDSDLVALRERLANPQGPSGGKLRRESFEVLKRVKKEIKDRERANGGPIVIFNAKAS